MIASSSVVSCNFSWQLKIKSPPLNSYSPYSSILSLNSEVGKGLSVKSSSFLERKSLRKRGNSRLCKSSSDSQTQEDPSLVSTTSEANELPVDDFDGGRASNEVGGEGRDWTTSFLLFAFWAGLMYYVFFLAPDQTPVSDSYFLKKLLNLRGDDGFKMNEVLVSLWYIMGLWPLVYSMLLLPTARSSEGKIVLWPFLILSCFGGAYVLIPYFVLWRPPAPVVEESELNRWPLNFLESKITAGITLTVGFAIIVYAFLSGGDAWKEFYQYFQGSKFIHVMTIDFALLATFAPFWVYNDMTARKSGNNGSWMLPLSLIPFLGPALYLLLRPSLSVPQNTLKRNLSDDK